MRNKKISAAEKETDLPINKLTSYLRRVNYISDKRIERINFSIPLTAKGRDEKTNKENSLPRNVKTLQRNFTIKNGKTKEKDGNYHNFLKEIKNFNEQTAMGNEERKYNFLRFVYSNNENLKRGHGSEMNVIFVRFNAIGCINENRKILINKGCVQFLEGLKESYKVFIVIDDDFSIVKLIICELFKINFYFDRIYAIERLPLVSRNKNKLFLDYSFHIDKNATKKIEKINNLIIFTSVSPTIYETLSKKENDLSSSEINNIILNTENLVPITDFEVKEKHFWLLKDFELNTRLEDYQEIFQIKNLKNLENNSNEIDLEFFYDLITRKIRTDTKNDYIFSSLSILKRKSMSKAASKKSTHTVLGAKTELKKNLFEFILNFKKENKLKNLLVGPTLEQYFENNSSALNTYLRNEINEGEKIQKVVNIFKKLKDNSEIHLEQEEGANDLSLNNNKIFMLKK